MGLSVIATGRDGGRTGRGMEYQIGYRGRCDGWFDILATGGREEGWEKATKAGWWGRMGSTGLNGMGVGYIVASRHCVGWCFRFDGGDLHCWICNGCLVVVAVAEVDNYCLFTWCVVLCLCQCAAWCVVRHSR